LAQADFLRYIDDLSDRHQVLYTTHSPFMVHSDRLHQVRVVEDKEKLGTVIASEISGSDPRTIFPLQAALGWTIAQNLFVSERNLLVEGPSELVYLKSMSALLESMGKSCLRDNITIVPVGGLDKLVTFFALLGASGLKLVVLHDYRGAPEQKLMELVRERIVAPKSLLNASQFRDLSAIGKDGIASDTEDLFDEEFYVGQFNETFKKELGGKQIKLGDLPPGSRIVDRLERHLASAGIQIRPSGGFNHYRVASHFSMNPPKKFNDDTINRFAAFFDKVNTLLA
jgi:predicted ATP-dependent endonuclease of OLD family